MEYKFIATQDDILTEELKRHVSKRFYKNIKAHKTVFFRNGIEYFGYKMVNKGDVISFDYERENEIEWDLYPSNLDIRYENKDYIVCYKRRGLLSIPKKSDPKSLYQEVLYYLSTKGLPLEVSILNRLDYETEGLCLVAKNRYAASLMSPVHENIKRKYLALLDGILDIKEGRIENYLIKTDDFNKREVTKDKINGKIAISNYKVIKEFGNKSLVEFELETGRTHQIRCHSKYLGHPIIGDNLYGDGIGNKMYLLSYYISFYDKINKEQFTYQIPDKEIEEWLK